MKTTINEQLNSRGQHKRKSHQVELEKASSLLLSCGSDLGVRRNGGRAGARFAPECIVAQWNAMAQRADTASFCDVLVKSDAEDFDGLQREQTDSILQTLGKFNGKNIVHLGGGHDHVYPLLLGLEQQYGPEKIVIINIDAHTDTRTDELFHSGTPFRQFAKTSKTKTLLLQVGLHDYANGQDNFDQMPNTKMESIYADECLSDQEGTLKKIEDYLKSHAEEKTLFVLSLDCDGLSAHEMSAVSAVNHRGLPAQMLFNIIDLIKRVDSTYPLSYGIYEYNPLFDDLSNAGSRLLAATIDHFTQR